MIVTRKVHLLPLCQPYTCRTFSYFYFCVVNGSHRFKLKTSAWEPKPLGALSIC